MYPKTSDTIGSSASWLGGLVSLISGLGIWKMKKSKKKQTITKKGYGYR